MGLLNYIIVSIKLIFVTLYELFEGKKVTSGAESQEVREEKKDTPEVNFTEVISVEKEPDVSNKIQKIKNTNVAKKVKNTNSAKKVKPSKPKSKKK